MVVTVGCSNILTTSSTIGKNYVKRYKKDFILQSFRRNASKTGKNLCQTGIKPGFCL